MAIDSPSPSAQKPLFLGVSAAEAQANYDRLDAFYGTDKDGNSLLGDYFTSLTRFISDPELSWASDNGTAFDEGRHALHQHIAKEAHIRHNNFIGTCMIFMTDYIVDFGRRDLYGEERATNGVMGYRKEYGLDSDDEDMVYLASAQMLSAESQAVLAHHAFAKAHGVALHSLEGSRDKLDQLMAMSLPLIELTALAFRNRAFMVMGGTAKPGIKIYEPGMYDMLVTKLEITEDFYIRTDEENDQMSVELRERPTFPPAPGLKP